MMDLSTEYLGLKLKNPVVISASPLQKDIDNIKRMEDAGAAAVVMHSLFEEQIDVEGQELNRWLENGAESHAEALSYLPDLETYNLGPERYLEHLSEAKASVGIPIIASLNGAAPRGWMRYAKLMEQAGADALELNTYNVVSDPATTGAELEAGYGALVAQVRAALGIPLAVKLSSSFSALANAAVKLDEAGANALVLFNRFYQPDFDLDSLEVVPRLSLSRPYELLPRLSWTAILFGRVKADLAITGGVHGGTDVIKCMMAGARAAMMTSALLEKGIGHIETVLAEMKSWMEEHEYQSIRQMQGSMARSSVRDPASFERINYMKVLSSYALKSEPR